MRDKIIGYYTNIKKINKFKNKHKEIEKKIDEVADSMIGAHIILNSSIPAQQYTDTIQGKGGKPTSSMDSEIEKIYRDRENLLLNLKREKAYLYNKILELEANNLKIENSMLHLEEHEVKLLEARFKYNKAVRVIANEMFYGVESTTYNKIKEVLEKVKNDKNLEKICSN